MNSYLVFVFVAVAFPFAAASYGNSQFGGYGSAQNNFFQSNGGGGGGNGGVEELLNVGGGGGNQHNGGGSLTAAADVAASPSAQAGFAQANAQLQALSVNPSFQNLKNSESIAEKLSENHLALNIQQGNINVVPPNVVGQTAFRTLLVPNAMNNHQVIATQPLQPIVVNQPGSPPAQVNSGPPAVVRAAPIVYKLKPSVIYQQEIINKVPAPLSLNPVYVKVYKSGKQVDAPVSTSSYSSGGHSYGNSGGASVNGNGAGYETSQYANAAQPAVYGGQSGY